LVERFGSARDEWIKEDLEGWLAPNRIYDGVADALRRLKEREDVYIVTTKQACWSPRLMLRHLGPEANRSKGSFVKLVGEFQDTLFIEVSTSDRRQNKSLPRCSYRCLSAVLP
jgi:hypothetical protein